MFAAAARNRRPKRSVKFAAFHTIRHTAPEARTLSRCTLGKLTVDRQIHQDSVSWPTASAACRGLWCQAPLHNQYMACGVYDTRPPRLRRSEKIHGRTLSIQGCSAFSASWLRRASLHLPLSPPPGSPPCAAARRRCHGLWLALGSARTPPFARAPRQRLAPAGA
jgi:hypothetical protein